MCIFRHVDIAAQVAAAQLQARAEAEYAARRRLNSRTPYQDELAVQLERVQNQWYRGQFVKRRFYCAGVTWEASVWVASDDEALH